MKAKSMDLVWIVVKDFKKAIKFYTEIAGLKLLKVSEEHGWAELEGHEGGAMIGIAAEKPQNPYKAGQNGCLTFSVDDIEKAQEDLQKKGVQLLGGIQEIPGHVKLLLARDADGNHFQLAQMLE
ncbi:MAG: VOC family protein [Verrucomicrobia bacterium]|nr:VOC family protein [Verrucomicrobiota bacterium]